MFIAKTEICKFSPVRDDTKIDRVAKYIMNHEKHHKKKSFREEYVDIEYVDLLEQFKISHEKKFIFKDIEE